MKLNLIYEEMDVKFRTEFSNKIEGQLKSEYNKIIPILYDPMWFQLNVETYERLNEQQYEEL